MVLSLCSLLTLNQTGRMLWSCNALFRPAPILLSKYGYATDKRKHPKPAPPVEDDPLPAYVQSRLDLWTKLKAQQDELIAQKSQDLLQVTLPDGKIAEGFTWETTPFDVAKQLSNSLANEVIVAKVNGELWDLERPFEADSTLHLLKFSEPEAKAVYWNSMSFILGEALERAYGVRGKALLATAAQVENGLYYDVYLEQKAVTAKDFPIIESKVVRSFYAKNSFERLEVDKSNLLDIFAYNQFKIQEINDRVADGGKGIVYRCGSHIDFCQLPHVRYNKRIKAYKLRKVESVKWKDDVKLHRIHAIAFPSDNQLKEWVKQQAGRK